MSNPPLYLIGGPTASGKTAAALELAAKEGGAIINTDAMQVYRGLPLLTAQPSAAQKAACPHFLFEIFGPEERSSAGRWLALARDAIAQARAQDHTPILVGGTGLYFASLLGELADIPSIPDEVRAAALSFYNKVGHDAFRAELAKSDPDSAARIKRNDRQRLIRSYEVVQHTGKPITYWQAQGRAASVENSFTVHRRLLMPEREALYAACDARFLKMMEAGALEEVKALLPLFDSRFELQEPARSRPLAGRVREGGEEGLSSFPLPQDSLPALKILGVPELAAHLRGDLSLDEAVARAQQSTRNYAKRQVTWFRHQW
ncbi:MAG: tRNA (adenosine(37)-N6)-dimethylallyltransferase MiaA [Bdellovibrionales bacterium]